MLTSYTRSDRTGEAVEMKPPTVYSVVCANSSPFVSTDENEAKRRYETAVKNGVKDVLIYKTSPDGDVETHTAKPTVCKTCGQIDLNGNQQANANEANKS